MVIAVARLGFVAQPLVIVKPAVRRRSARARTLVCLRMVRAGALTSTNARGLGSVTAAVLQDIVGRPPLIALQDVKPALEHVPPPISRLMGHTAVPTSTSAKAQALETAVVHLAIVAPLRHIARLVARQHSGHALLLKSRRMAHAAEQTSTSAPDLPLATAAVLLATAESRQIIATQVARLVLVHARL